MTSRTEPGSAPQPGGSRPAALVAAGIFLSRLSGFARERAFAYFFGSSDFADAWRAALRMPNVIQNLLGEGTLSASFIPVYASFLEEGREDEAGRFAGAALGILILVAGALVLVGILTAPFVIPIFFPRWDPQKQALTVTLVRILLPMTGVLVVSAWALGVLNSHRRFFVSYVAPVFWNIAQIAALVVGGAYYLLGERDLVVLLAWGALAGGTLQFGAQVPFVLRHLRGFRLSTGRNVEGVSEAVRNFGPVVAARGVVNLSGWLDLILAAQLAGGAVAILGYAQTFYMLPISIFGMSVAASELPELSRMRDHDREVLRGRVAAALKRVSFFLVPSVVGYLALGDVIIAGLYETGHFGAEQTLVTWGVLSAYALGLAASARSRVLSSAFYALRDTRTPARIAYARVAISAMVGILLMFPLDAYGFQRVRLGAAGLALGAAAGAWFEYAQLRRSLAGTIGTLGPGAGPFLRMTLAAALAAAVAVWVQVAASAMPPLVLAAAVLSPYAIVYLAAAHLLGVGESLRGGQR